MWYEIAILTKDGKKVKAFVETIVMSGNNDLSVRGWKPLVKYTRLDKYKLRVLSKTLAEELAFMIHQRVLPDNKVVVIAKDYEWRDYEL